MSEVKAFLTVLGATVIAYVEGDTPEAYKLENALFLSVQPGPNGQISLNLGPISVFAPGEIQKGMTLDLLKDKVVIVHDVREEVKQQYSQVVGRIAVVGAGTIDLNAARNAKR
jgi:hypothetical protein